MSLSNGLPNRLAAAPPRSISRNVKAAAVKRQPYTLPASQLKSSRPAMKRIDSSAAFFQDCARKKWLRSREPNSMPELPTNHTKGHENQIQLRVFGVFRGQDLTGSLRQTCWSLPFDSQTLHSLRMYEQFDERMSGLVSPHVRFHPGNRGAVSENV